MDTHRKVSELQTELKEQKEYYEKELASREAGFKEQLEHGLSEKKQLSKELVLYSDTLHVFILHIYSFFEFLE